MRDVVFVVFSLLSIVGQASSGSGPGSEPGAATGPGAWGAQEWFMLCVGVTASLALLWRRRFPISVTVLTIVATAVAGTFIPMGFALLSLAIRRRDGLLALLGVAGCAAYVGSLWENSDEPLVLLITGPFVIGAWIAFGGYVGTRRDLLATLRDRAERAEAERELRAEQARLGERARIAQEMHDVLAHKVSLIALHAGGLEVNPAVGPEKVESSAGLIRQTARQAMEDLREVLGVLRTDVSVDGADLTPVPKAADLERLIEDSRAAGVNVRSELYLPDEVPVSVGRTVYRIVQEALTNVHKHARGVSTEVLVQGAEGDGVSVRVTNVRPVAADSLLPGSGAGLVGLRERVNLSGGRLAAGPTPDGGWRVEAWLPWSDSREGAGPDASAEVSADSGMEAPVEVEGQAGVKGKQ